MTSRGQCPKGGGGVLVNVLTPPPPFRKSCIRAWPRPIDLYLSLRLVGIGD